MKIGIMGGCFNPPHNMHKKIVLDLINLKYLDKVIIVPTGNNYNKEYLVNEIDRYNMLEEMFKNNPNVIISDYEFNKTLTYTYQTLDHFKSLYENDDIYFVTGTDNLKEIKTWKNYQYLLDTYKMLIIKRNNDNTEEIIKDLNNINLIPVFLDLTNISSTLVRKKIKNKENVKNELDIEVIKYIKENNLYL